MLLERLLRVYQKFLAKGGAGAVGAGSAAAIGGPVSTAVGTGVGFAAGAGSEVFRQSAIVEGGLIFNDLIKDGVDPEIASKVSQVAGIINGVLEVVSAGIIAAPIKAWCYSFGKKVNWRQV